MNTIPKPQDNNNPRRVNMPLKSINFLVYPGQGRCVSLGKIGLKGLWAHIIAIRTADEVSNVICQVIRSFVPDSYICLLNLDSGGCLPSRLLFCKEIWPTLNEYPRYGTKQSDDEFLIMLELWGMLSTPLSLSLPGPLWPGVVVSDRVESMDQIELNCILMLNWIVWNGTILTFNCVKKKLSSY